MSGLGPGVEQTDKLRAQLAASERASRCLTKVLIWLTAVIAVLTAVLVYRTF